MTARIINQKYFLFKNVVVISFFCTCIELSAQVSEQSKWVNESWNSKTKIISLGVGMPNIDQFYFVQLNTSNPTKTVTTVSDNPVVHGKIEFATSKHLGIGLTINRSLWNYSESYLTRGPNGYPVMETNIVKLRVSTFNFRVNYHFVNAKLFDPYIGLGIGLRFITKTSPNGNNVLFEYKTPFSFEATVGARILINSLCGFYFETGIGRSLLQGGLVFNFGKF